MTDPSTILLFLSLLGQVAKGGNGAPPGGGGAGPPGPPGGSGSGFPSSMNPVASAAASAATAQQAAAISQDPIAAQHADVATQHAAAAAATTDPVAQVTHAGAAADAASQAIQAATGGAGAPAAAPSPAPAPAPTVAPGAMPAMPPWGSAVVPSGLPPFPGPGWTPDTPVAQTVAGRAAYWNPQLWNYGSKQIVKPFVQEQYGGRWLTFVAAWHPDSSGNPVVMATEAWRLATDSPAVDAQGASVPTPAQQVAVQQAAAATTPAPAPQVAPAPGKPPPVQPYPGTGAWKSNPIYIRRYQAALTYLGFDPGGITGVASPATMAAVVSFERAHGLTVDTGQAGPQVAAALDAALGYGGGGAAPAVADDDGSTGTVETDAYQAAFQDDSGNGG
jgi:hypothetical protein